MNEKNIVGGISLEAWKKAFAQAVRNNIDHGYFDDILYYHLYPEAIKEANKIEEEDEEAACDILNEKWEFVDEAFKVIFDADRNDYALI